MAKWKRLEDKVAGLNRLFTDYKTRAKSKGLKFSLIKNKFKELITSDCHYCGIKPSNKIHPSKRRSKNPLAYNGLDRVNNQLGYTYKNSVSCCKVCNIAKNDMSIEKFLEWVVNVYKVSQTLS